MATRSFIENVLFTVLIVPLLVILYSYPAEDVIPALLKSTSYFTYKEPVAFRVEIFERTSGMAQHPEVLLEVPKEYKIIGGGAKANWLSAGITLNYINFI